MNTLEIIGGRKDQREMAHRVVGFMINTLMPRMRTLDITVEFTNIKGDAVGFCMKTDNNLLLLKTNMEAGHGGKSGRFDSLYELAEEYTFFLSQLGLIE